MSNHQYINIDVPYLAADTDKVLEDYRLPLTYALPFGEMLRLLIGFGKSLQNGTNVSMDLYKLGKAFHSLGAGDEIASHKYMQAAHAGARDIYGHDFSFLNSEWSGIGRWLA